MATLQDIIYGRGETLVTHNHLQQMLTFLRGSGVEFLPVLDAENQRKAFLDGLVEVNRIKTRIKVFAIRMIKFGRILLYLRPVGKTYKLQDYKPEQYRAYYDANGDLESAVIIYSYKQLQTGGQTKDRWVKLRLTAQTVETLESANQLQFDQESPLEIPNLTPNRLGFIPCIEVLNPAPASDEEGISDFKPLASQIEAHDTMTTAILDNLYFFCNSPLITTREASEVTEAMGVSSGGSGAPDSFPDYAPLGDNHTSVAAASGFHAYKPPAFPGDRRRDRARKLKRVIGGVEADELFQQLQINPVPPEMVSFADQYERQLRESLGGILERGIETATESRVVYGKVAATAAEKQEALFTHGLCQIFKMALLAEESLYAATGGVEGLPPLGDRAVTFRVGEVFQQTPESLNYRSITARNLAKFFGVAPKEAIKYVFPEKSETEIDKMVSDGGFPSDYLQTAIAMFAQLTQTLDPLTGTPIADPATGLPLAYKLTPFIIQGLDYGQQFDTVTPDIRTDRDTGIAALAGALAYVQRQAAERLAVGGANPGGVDAPSLPSPGSTVGTPKPANLPPFFDLNRSPILNAARSAFGG